MWKNLIGVSRVCTQGCGMLTYSINLIGVRCLFLCRSVWQLSLEGSMTHPRAAWNTKQSKSLRGSKCHCCRLYHFAGFLCLSRASMLAFGEHSYLAFLFEIWHRSMVCRLEDICCNLESRPRISHDDFGTDRLSIKDHFLRLLGVTYRYTRQ